MSDSVPMPPPPVPQTGPPPMPHAAGYPLPPAPTAPPFAPPAGYAGAPAHGYGPPPQTLPPIRGAAPAARPATLGVVALVLALVAVVAGTVVGAVAGHRIGVLIGADVAQVGRGDDLSFLSPARGWVLVGELAFWIATALGLWAVIQGAIALGTRRGFGAGLAAIIVAAVGPVVFLTVLAVALGVGSAL